VTRIFSSKREHTSSTKTLTHHSRRTPHADNPRILGGRPGLLASAVLFAVLSAMALLAAPAFALPEGRVYELVTPPYKGGYAAKSIEAVAPDGESVAYFTPGAFAGTPSGPVPGIAYIARRTPTGWSTVPTTPPAGLIPHTEASDVSPTLSTVMYMGKAGGGNNEGAVATGTEEEFLLHSTGLPDALDENWEPAGKTLKTVPVGPGFHVNYEDASSDFCHIILKTAGTNLGERYLLPKEAGVVEPFYELDRGCDGERVVLRSLGLNNQQKAISPTCGINLGVSESYSTASMRFNAVADDGGEVFFTTCTNGGTGRPAEPHQLFVRLGGSRTLEVSKPLGEACAEVPCLPGAVTRGSAAFQGASEDGSKVFFTTRAPLVAGDTDAENDLYMASIGCPVSRPECGVSEKEVTELTQVSHSLVSGESAEVQGVVKVAPDGSRVYFVARGMLTSVPGPEGRVAQAGADNLYVYSSASGISFVADLCSGKELSGAAEDIRCPNATGGDTELWTGEGNEAQTAGPDGGFLVFSTYAQLTSSDTDAAKDVYRYDAETGVIDRVSIGEDGADANGNNSEFNATIALPGGNADYVAKQYKLGDRAISEDGSRIVFTSSEPLSPAAQNHLPNVYEWHQEADGEERSSLISTGSSEEPVEEVVISATGSDIFFITSQGLVPQDTDGAADIYDARLDGGFSSPPAQRRPCEGEACYGSLTNPAPLLVPGSVSQAPGGNFTTPAAKPASTPKKKTVVKCAKGRKPIHGRCVKTKSKKIKAKKAANKKETSR
jgi:hypothetical protein